MCACIIVATTPFNERLVYLICQHIFTSASNAFTQCIGCADRLHMKKSLPDDCRRAFIRLNDNVNGEWKSFISASFRRSASHPGCRHGCRRRFHRRFAPCAMTAYNAYVVPTLNVKWLAYSLRCARTDCISRSRALPLSRSLSPPLCVRVKSKNICAREYSKLGVFRICTELPVGHCLEICHLRLMNAISSVSP